MNKREELIEKYATDLKTKCNINPEMDLLTKVTNAFMDLQFTIKTPVVFPHLKVIESNY